MKLLRTLVVLFLLLLTNTTSYAETVDPALVGKWQTKVGEGGEQRERTLLWQITATGNSTMHTISRETGFLSTNPERWGITSPDTSYEVEHGFYKVAGPDSFSTVIAGLPYDWITWNRVPRGSSPQGIDACILNEVMSEPGGEVSQTEFNPALVGLWQASTTKADGSRVAMVWRISPSGQSTFITVEILPLPMEAHDGQLKIMPANSQGGEGTYSLINNDAFEMSDSDTTTQWTRCSGGGASR
jgi:hypothetical protein